jgi:hypothetical protein
MLEKFVESLRQTIVYSKEFRIAAPRWWDLTDALAIEDIIELIRSSKSRDETSSPDDQGLLNLTMEMGTTFWRLQRRVTAGGEVPQEMRRILRDIEAMEDALRQASIEVKDHTGQKYVDGMALKVIARQETPGIACEMVIETIKPTIYCRNNLVQRGEVIVGIPESDAVS